MKNLVLSFILTIGGCQWFSSPKACKFFPEWPAPGEPYGKEFFIAHAGGGIHSYTYTNSVEALKNAIANGYKMIELDLALTSDGKIVGVHDWAHFNKLTGHEELGDKALSFKEFKSRKVHGQYTPVTFIEIEKIFSENPELILVTDKITDFDSIVSTFSFQDRIIMEIFSVEDYARAKEAGILHPMLSVGDKELQGELLKELDVKMIALHSSSLDKWSEKLEALNAQGVCAFAFTSNDEKFIRKNLAARRATAFYTDFWDLKTHKCSQSKAECITY